MSSISALGGLQSRGRAMSDAAMFTQRLPQMTQIAPKSPSPMAGAREQARTFSRPYGMNLAVPGTPREG